MNQTSSLLFILSMNKEKLNFHNSQFFKRNVFNFFICDLPRQEEVVLHPGPVVWSDTGPATARDVKSLYFLSPIDGLKIRT